MQCVEMFECLFEHWFANVSKLLLLLIAYKSIYRRKMTMEIQFIYNLSIYWTRSKYQVNIFLSIFEMIITKACLVTFLKKNLILCIILKYFGKWYKKKTRITII